MSSEFGSAYLCSDVDSGFAIGGQIIAYGGLCDASCRFPHSLCDTRSCKSILEANREKVLALADQLVEHGRIEALDVLNLMNG
jgi:hypothetical protein